MGIEMKKSIGLLALLLPFAVCAHEVEMADHAHHHHEMPASTEAVAISANLPNVPLLTQDGRKVMLHDAVADGKLQVLSFIFTSCQTVCPMTSQTLSQLQTKLGADMANVHMLSISIDPEYDTPGRLKTYAAKYHAAKGWDHYTGSEKDARQIQIAMGAYRADKMNHVPVYYLSDGKSGKWYKYEGLVSPDTLLHGLHKLMETH